MSKTVVFSLFNQANRPTFIVGCQCYHMLAENFAFFFCTALIIRETLPRTVEKSKIVRYRRFYRVYSSLILYYNQLAMHYQATCGNGLTSDHTHADQAAPTRRSRDSQSRRLRYDFDTSRRRFLQRGRLVWNIVVRDIFHSRINLQRAVYNEAVVGRNWSIDRSLHISLWLVVIYGRCRRFFTLRARCNEKSTSRTRGQRRLVNFLRFLRHLS